MTTAPPFRSMVDKTGRDHEEEPLEYYALTGLTTGQLHKLGLLVMQEIGSLVKAGAKSRRRSDCSTRWSWSSC